MGNTNESKNEVKSRVNSLKESFEERSASSDEEKQSILKARTHALASEEKDETAGKVFIEVVVFGLASETYAVESSFITEVYPLNDFTPLPGTPSFVFGIINVRGQIISVIDLKKFFNLPEIGLGQLNRVIIIRSERMEFGILADIIHGTQLVSTDSIQTSLPNISGIGAEYLKGITTEHLIILDAKKILDDERMIVNQEAK